MLHKLLLFCSLTLGVFGCAQAPDLPPSQSNIQIIEYVLTAPLDNCKIPIGEYRLGTVQFSTTPEEVGYTIDGPDYDGSPFTKQSREYGPGAAVITPGKTMFNLSGDTVLNAGKTYTFTAYGKIGATTVTKAAQVTPSSDTHEAATIAQRVRLKCL